MSEHTPGPWDASLNETLPTARYCGAIVARVGCGEVEEIKTNARLITAAPDLLDILKRLVMYYENSATQPEAKAKIRDAKAAIAKAEEG